MKKSMIFVGMLAIGYANAQEGVVGINTENPKATLDIQPNAENLSKTTNEGLLIPRLSKARVASIASGNLVEGTKVYVTDEVTAADTQFIGTGKGFYFYNGTKWVKQLASDTNANTELWAQRDNAGVTETYLKPAGDKTDFVGYRSDRKWNINLGNVKNDDFVYEHSNVNINKGLAISEVPFLTAISSDIFPDKSTVGNNKFFYTHNNSLLKENHVSKNPTGRYYGQENRLVVKDVTSNINDLYATNASVDVLSNNTLSRVVGVQGSVSIGSNNGKYSTANATNAIGAAIFASNLANTTNLTGIRVESSNYKNAENLIGGSFSSISNNRSEASTIKTIKGIANEIVLKSNSTINNQFLGIHSVQKIETNSIIGQQAELRGIISSTEIGQNVTSDVSFINFISHYDIKGGSNLKSIIEYGTWPVIKPGARIGTYTGYNIGTGEIDNSAEIEQMTGLSISNMIRGKKNFAIYTNRGIVRFGDNVGVGVDAPTQKIETAGNILANGGLMSNINDAGGGYLELINPLKTEGKLVKRWRIFNMTDKETTYKYTNGLHFWAYAADGTNLSSQMVITDEGNLGIGFASDPNRTTQTTEKLEVNGNARIVGLKGTGTRNVVADENGVLRVGEATATGATSLTGETGLVCNASNRGKMNFIQGADGKSDVFGICMKNADGNYYWGYMVGGNNPTNGTGAFGSGL